MNPLLLPSAHEWGYPILSASPEELISALAVAVEAALHNFTAIPDGPEPCREAEGYSRASVEIALPRTLADQLMNGSTGYRAHYSVSVEAGEWFNRMLVEAAAPLIIEAEHNYEMCFCKRFCSRSLLGRCSKLWYPKRLTDPSAQDELLRFPEVLQLPRWVDYWRKRAEPANGLRAPISDPPCILLNGTFVNSNGDLYEQIPGRSRELFETGWT